ncbi:hypothetical protein GCM10010276_78110 [Streptomyces longisporus]|uniref:Uncharacterized protein n=1 Tax=Streptomyces longisporus TaxID=1948 RepID=A0ABP6AJN7_STRLO
MGRSAIPVQDRQQDSNLRGVNPEVSATIAPDHVGSPEIGTAAAYVSRITARTKRTPPKEPRPSHREMISVGSDLHGGRAIYDRNAPRPGSPREPGPVKNSGAYSPAALRSASTRSVFSQVNSGSSRPKWPYAAVWA